jgi:DNA-binding beta-propeller fold protein YncE
MKRFLWLGFVLCLELICSGCGDTFRPIIIPNPPTFPNPKAAHTVVAINDNGIFTPGTAMVVDVSGDTNVSVANVDLAPVHAVQQTATQVLVVNQAVTGLNPPPDTCLVAIPPNPPNQVFNVCSSITKLNFSGTVISSTSAITLPAYSEANFVATTEFSQAYVLLPHYIPDPIKSPTVIVPSVGVVNTQSNNLGTTKPVGSKPVAMAETPNAQKLYVANRDSNSISAFNTVGLSSRTVTGSFNAPLWVTARSDSQRVYVLNGDGVVSTIDTTSTAGPDNVIDASISAPNAAYMLYDGNKNRLYIPGGTQLTILDVSQSSPQILAGGPIAIPTVVPSLRLGSDPCSKTSEQTLTVAAVAALPDGSRAYVGAYYEDTVNSINYICPQVTVIDVKSNTIKSSTAVPGFPAYDAFCSTTIPTPRVRFRVTMAAGGDSSRVYLASCDGGNVNIIDTTSDSYILNLPAPIGVRPGGTQNLPQNPVFLFAGP